MKKIYKLIALMILISAVGKAQVMGTPYITINKSSNIGLDFDGVNDVVSLGNITSFSNVPQYTYEFWFRSANFGVNTTILGKRTDDTYREIHIQFLDSTGKIIAYVGNNWIISSQSLSQNRWYHIAVVYDGTQSNIYNRLKMYINGVLETVTYDAKDPVTNVYPAPYNPPSITPNSLAIFTIGSEYNSITPVPDASFATNPNMGGPYGKLFANMTMCQLRMYNVARTAQQIADNKDNFNLPLATTGLLYYYKMDQGIPNGNNSTQTILIDSKSGNTGNLFNFNLSGNISNFISLPF